jgi:hypothetical protein
VVPVVTRGGGVLTGRAGEHNPGGCMLIHYMRRLLSALFCCSQIWDAAGSLMSSSSRGMSFMC